MAMRNNVKVHARTQSNLFSHPVDCFSVIRFAIRVPILDIEVNDDDNDDDNNHHVDDDDHHRHGHGHQHDDSRGHAQDTQCFELCFHAGFVPSPDPVSLHILPSGRIEHHDPAPLLRTPHPPYYIHELPDLIDLTHTTDDAITTAIAPNPSSSSNTSPRLVIWLLLIALYTIAVLTGGVVLGRHLHPSNVGHLFPSSRPLLSLPHATYVLDVATVPTTQPLSLYEDILSLERLHLAAKADIAEVMATGPDLGLNCELGKLVSRMSRDVFALSRHNDENPVPTPPTLYADIKLTCQHILHRLSKLHRSLRALKAASLYHSDTKLFFTAWMLETAAEAGYDATSLPLAYAKGLLDPERDVWQQCHFCSTPPPAAPVDASYVGVLVADWHFACDMSFLNLSASLPSHPAAAINDYFKSWGKQQSARRFAALRSPPLDVDGTPMYPNNQHPFDEADEIHDALLPGESHLNGLVRNAVEISTAIDELLDLLGTLNVSAVSGLQADDAPSPPEVSSSRSWWQIPRSQPAPMATDRRIRIRQGTARLVNLQNDLLTPLVRSLGRASASMTVACDKANEQRTRVQRLAKGRGWDYEAAYISSSSSSSSRRNNRSGSKNSDGQEDKDDGNKNNNDDDDRGARVSSPSTCIVHVARTLFTADLAAEASALHAESAQRLAESQSAAAAAKATSTMRLLASRELATAATASSTTTTAAGWPEHVGDEPMSEEDLSFEQRVREKLDVYNEPMRRLADLLPGGLMD